MDTTSHLSAGQLAGYFDNALEAVERVAVERHLDDCPICRNELAELTRLNPSESPAEQRGRPRHAVRWLVPAVLAAGLGGLALIRPWRSAPQGVERPGTGPSESLARIEPVAPLEDATLPGTRVTFEWRARPADTYRITVMTESGEPVWSAETSDTVAVLPSSVALVAGASYFWRVEAVADGIVATSGARRLTVSP